MAKKIRLKRRIDGLQRIMQLPAEEMENTDHHNNTDGETYTEDGTEYHDEEFHYQE